MEALFQKVWEQNQQIAALEGNRDTIIQILVAKYGSMEATTQQYIAWQEKKKNL